MRCRAEALTVDCQREQSQLQVSWLGRSEMPDPSLALQPLLETFDAQMAGVESVCFDFRSLDYMNSSTIRPLLRLVQNAAGRALSVLVLYDGNKNWQRLSFGAITAVLASFPNVEVRG